MVKKKWDWKAGEKLPEHSRRKLEILRAYFARYLAVRCQMPTRQFRLAVVDGFAGGGRYDCNTPGSSIIFIEELRRAVEELNIKRSVEGMPTLEIGCLLVLNDWDRDALELLRENVEPLRAVVKDGTSGLHLDVRYISLPFEEAYLEIKKLLTLQRFRNVLFNLDQAGYRWVERSTISNIMSSFQSAEVFYTFAIQTLLTYLEEANPEQLNARLAFLGVAAGNLGNLDVHMRKQEWLGAAERLVFESLNPCAKYVTPFSVHNPDGWRYWFIHFANSYRARQEYNNVLHEKSSMQAHFGRSGLHMLGYDPNHVGNLLYLFDASGRKIAKEQLINDIPRVITDSGDAIGVGEFYEEFYNKTPAHSDDIHAAMIASPDLEIKTEVGGERRRAGTIKPGDTIRRKAQRSFSLFLPGKDHDSNME